MALTLDGLIALAGVVIPAASAIVSGINQAIRSNQEQKLPTPAWLLHAAALLNVCALNLDKALQLVKLARGK